MATTTIPLTEERIPLLSEPEESLTDDLRELQREFEREYPLRTPPREMGVADSTKPARQRKKHFSGNEMIVAVFVVAFDTKKGNIVEWRYPDEVNLEGVEFKSLASGLHNVPKDFIYFTHNQLYGLSCFEKIPVASEEERGARMKSVGLLAVGYSDLHLHMEFLQRQVRIQVETPGQYGSLEEYFRHYQSPWQSVPRPLASGSTSLGADNIPPMTITHPAGCFTQFLQFFGPKIFVLWRLTLLKKRILLFSPPPIGVVCYRVYCACMLVSHVLQADIDTDCNTQFYVNVADIEELQKQQSYIACTTEKIFQSKTTLYDVFIDNQNITTPWASLEPIIRLTPADQQRFEHLNNIRSNHLITARGAGDTQDDDLGFAAFFQELNSQLFRTMLDASSSEDHVLTIEMVDSLGLDPVRDRQFLTDLATLHRLNMNVQRPADMFDIFSCCGV